MLTGQTKLIETQGQLHESSHFEAEVREKSLAIGKLRHEGVILNEHLTRALKMLSKSKPQDNVDRQLITNLLLKFLALPRGDPKKYEVLQLIASFLNMSDEQREAAGLARPGTSGSVSGTGSISRASPFRTPSASMLVPDSPSVNKEVCSPKRSVRVNANCNRVWRSCGSSFLTMKQTESLQNHLKSRLRHNRSF